MDPKLPGIKIQSGRKKKGDLPQVVYHDSWPSNICHLPIYLQDFIERSELSLLKALLAIKSWYLYSLPCSDFYFQRRRKKKRTEQTYHFVGATMLTTWKGKTFHYLIAKNKKGEKIKFTSNEGFMHLIKAQEKGDWKSKFLSYQNNCPSHWFRWRASNIPFLLTL